MKKYTTGIGFIILLGMTSCTSLSQGARTSELATVPEERVQLGTENTETLRQGMNEQASEINRKRNIEQFNRNDPAMTPPASRPVQVPNAPVNRTMQNNLRVPNVPANTAVQSNRSVINNTEWLMPHTFKNRLILR